MQGLACALNYHGLDLVLLMPAL